MLAVSAVLQNAYQANATQYFGALLSKSTMGTVVFHFRVYIDLFQFTNRDLAVIVVSLNENVLVNRNFKLSNGLNTKQIQLVNEGGIVAVNESGVFPEIRLLNSQYVIYEDSVIYNGLPSDIEMNSTTQYGFDLNIIIVGVENGEVQQGPIGRGNVTLLTPPGIYTYLQLETFCCIVAIILYYVQIYNSSLSYIYTIHFSGSTRVLY